MRPHMTLWLALGVALSICLIIWPNDEREDRAHIRGINVEGSTTAGASYKMSAESMDAAKIKDGRAVTVSKVRARYWLDGHFDAKLEFAETAQFSDKDGSMVLSGGVKLRMNEENSFESNELRVSLHSGVFASSGPSVARLQQMRIESGQCDGNWKERKLELRAGVRLHLSECDVSFPSASIAFDQAMNVTHLQIAAPVMIKHALGNFRSDGASFDAKTQQVHLRQVHVVSAQGDEFIDSGAIGSAIYDLKAQKLLLRDVEVVGQNFLTK